MKTEHWQTYFNSISQDAILVKVNDRVLHYWGSDGFYRIYPTSVPLTEEMTRRGRTSVTLKRPDPDWRPTPAMLKRNPDLPGYVPPGPDNPLGIRALNLGWPAYRIHGTNDIRKIGAAVVVGLHRALQRAHPRGLRPRPDRHPRPPRLTGGPPAGRAPTCRRSRAEPPPPLFFPLDCMRRPGRRAPPGAAAAGAPSPRPCTQREKRPARHFTDLRTRAVVAGLRDGTLVLPF